MSIRKMLKLAARKLLEIDNNREMSDSIVTYCAWCGNEIHEGDRITLQSNQSMLPLLPLANAILWKQITPYNAIYVGCARPSCCENSADTCATWFADQRGYQGVVVDVCRGNPHVIL